MYKVLVVAFLATFLPLGTFQQSTKPFEDSKVVPDVIRETPKAILNIEYKNNVKVELGKEISVLSVRSAPSTASWPKEPSKLYTLIMVDPDYVNAQNTSQTGLLHWLVVNIPENDVRRGQTVLSYKGPRPPKDGKFHRYVFLIYKQTEEIKSRSPFERRGFRVETYAKANKLDQSPVAGTFFRSKVSPDVQQ